MTQVNKERMLAEFKEIVALPCHSLQEANWRLSALRWKRMTPVKSLAATAVICGHFCLLAQVLKVRYAYCFLHIWTVLSPAAALPLSKRTAFYTATALLFSAVTTNPALRVF